MTDTANRFLYSYEVYDNKTKTRIAYDAGNCSGYEYVKKQLKEALEQVEKAEMREQGICPECDTELSSQDNGKTVVCPGCGYTEA